MNSTVLLRSHAGSTCVRCFAPFGSRPRLSSARGGGCRAQARASGRASFAETPSSALPECSVASSQEDCGTFLARNLMDRVGGAINGAVSPYLLAALVVVMVLAPGGAATAADPSHLHHHFSTQFDLAEGGEDFWSNVVRYGRYFVTVMLGTGYVIVKPLLPLFKKPVTAVLAITGIVGLVTVVKLTLDAMLGISEPSMLFTNQSY